MRWGVVLLVLVALLRPGEVRAQQIPLRIADRADVLVGRTRELLDFADGRIRGCGDDRALDLVGRAMELQARAEDALEDGRKLAALQLTRGARERCLEAMGLCHFEEDVPAIAERALDRTDRLLDRERGWTGPGRALGRPFVGGGSFAPPPRARAAAIQDDAWRAFRAGRYETSLRLTLAARTLARRGPP